MKDFFNNYKKELKGTVVGILIGILVMLIFWPERIAELKDKEQVAITVDGKNITADSIYKGMKNKYSANEIVEQVDRIILDKKYTITDDDLKEIKKNAENYYSTYQSYYNITKEEFLKQNNFDSEDDFLKYLELDYKRNKLVNEYMETSVTDKEIEEYYNDNYFTPFKVEHILVKTKDNDNAKKDAEEILKYLKKNSWEDTKTKYKDKITTESFDVKFDSNLEENFVKAAKKLKDGKYLLAISDGMGSGPEAMKSSKIAIKMLERLLSAGFEKDVSLKLINSTLSANTSEDMYATLDIQILDLFSGNMEFIKNSACPTFVKRNGEVQLLKSITLPAGILDQADLVVYDYDIQDGDILVMCSDGIIDSNKEYLNKQLWVKYLLEDIETDDAQKIADIIMNEAIDNDFGKQKDDMTVMVAKVTKK